MLDSRRQIVGRISYSLLLVTTSLVLSSCNYRVLKAVDTSKMAGFQKISAEVVQPMCIRCHQGAQAGGGMDFSTYESLMASGTVKPFDNTSVFLTDLKLGKMPKDGGRLPDTLVKDVEDWIMNGAPKSTGAGPVVTPTPTFAYINQYIFKPKCAGCHRPGGDPDTTYDMRTYASIMAGDGDVKPGDVDSSNLYAYVYGETMPKNAPPLSTAEKTLIRDWIEQGAKQ